VVVRRQDFHIALLLTGKRAIFRQVLEAVREA